MYMTYMQVDRSANREIETATETEIEKEKHSLSGDIICRLRKDNSKANQALPAPSTLRSLGWTTN